MKLYPRLNEMHFYAWGDDACCLARGATKATLIDDHTDLLAVGDIIIFEERVSPTTYARR